MRSIRQQRCKLRLLEHISSRKRHSSSGMRIERLVLTDHLHNLVHRIAAAGVYCLLHLVRDRGIPVLRFRIGTPAALKRASFEENCCANAGSVIDAEFLNIQDSACQFQE